MQACTRMDSVQYRRADDSTNYLNEGGSSSLTCGNTDFRQTLSSTAPFLGLQSIVYGTQAPHTGSVEIS